MRFYILTVLIFSQVLLNAQITFKKQFHAPFLTNASTVLQTYDHGYLIMSTVGVDFYTFYTWLIKTNETGDTLWSKMYSNGKHGFLKQGMVQCSDSGFALLGVKNGVYLLRLTKNGDSLWGKELGSGSPYSIEISQHNEFIISGVDTAVLYIRTSYDGQLLIHKNIPIVPIGNIGSKCGYSLKSTNDNGSIIGGTVDWTGNSFAFLIKTDYYGNIQWDRKFTYLEESGGYSVDITKDSGFVLAGVYSDGALLLKSNFLGDTMWLSEYTSLPWYSSYLSVATCNEGDYVACGGTTDPHTGNQQVLLMKTNPNGSRIWSRNLYSAKRLEGVSVKQTYDGGFIILGDIQENDSSSIDLILMKTDSSGEVSWIKNVYNAPLFSFYPNPASQYITIENREKTKSVEIELFDLTGNCVARSHLKPMQDKTTIYVGSLKPGEYLLKIFNEDKIYLIKKIIKF